MDSGGGGAKSLSGATPELARIQSLVRFPREIPSDLLSFGLHFAWSIGELATYTFADLLPRVNWPWGGPLTMVRDRRGIV